MLKASLLATASVFLIGTASAQNNCNANPDQPFCQGGGEYDDTELRDRISTNEINIAELDVELRRQIDIFQEENVYIYQDLTVLNDAVFFNRREHLLLEDRVDMVTNDLEDVRNESFQRDQALNAGMTQNAERIDQNQRRIEEVDQNVARVEANSIIRDNILADAIDETNETLDAEVLRLDARIDAIVITPYNDEPLWEAVDDLNGRVNLLGDQVTNNTVRIESIERSVEELRDEVNAGLAGVAAMGSIPTALAGQTSVGVGYGNWAGESAFALGASTRSKNGRHAFTASGTTTNESTGFSAGYSFSF